MVMKTDKIVTRIEQAWLIFLGLLLFLNPLLMLRANGKYIITEIAPDIVSISHYVPFITNLLLKEAFAQSFIFILLGLTLTRKCLLKDWHFKRSFIDYPVLLLITLSGFSLLYTKTLPLTYECWGLLGSFTILFYLILDFPWNPKRVRFILWMVLASVILTALMATLQHLQIYLGGLLPQAEDRNRMSATIGHNNGVACMMMLGIFILLGLRKGINTKWKKVFSILAGVLLLWFLFVIVATLSRGVWMGTLTGIILLFAWHIRKTGWHSFTRKYWKAGVITLIFLAGFISVLSFPNRFNPLGVSVIQRLHDTFLQQKTYLRDDRIRMWAGTLEVIRQHPVLGVGLGGFQYWIPVYQGHYFARYPDSQLEPTFKLTNHSHNEYLEPFAELGIGGFICALWLAGLILLTGKSLFKKEDTFCSIPRWYFYCGVIGVMVQSLVDFPLHVAPLALLFILLGGFIYSPEPVETTSSPEAMIPSLAGKDMLAICTIWVLVIVLQIPLIQKVQADYYKNRMDYFLQASEDFTADRQWTLREKALGKAMEYGNKSLALAPRNGRTHYEMALGYLKWNKIPEAIEHFELSLRDLQYAESHFNLADAYEWLRRQALAKGDTQSAQMALDNAIEHYRMAAYIYPPKKSLAEQYKEQRLFYMPSEALHRYGVLLYQSGRKEEALAAWKKIAANDPYYIQDKYLKLADGYIQKAQYPEAIQLLLQAQYLAPSDKETLYHLVGVYYLANKREDCYKILNQLLEMDPKDPKATYGMALVSFNWGDKQKALDYAMKTVEINPLHPGIQDLLKKLAQQ
jgi:putative inorganic carbon (HCO3(-)) transporter